MFLYLYLLHSEVQEGVLVADTDQALGAFASHAGAQASVQLHHHQLVQTVSHIVRQASASDLVIGLDLEERKRESVRETAGVAMKCFQNQPLYRSYNFFSYLSFGASDCCC